MLLDRDPRSVRIERLMAERSRSFRWLAEKLGTSHVSVRKWILGEAKPRDDAVWRQMLDLLEESGSVSHVDNLLARGIIGYAVAILGDQDGRNVEWRMGAHLRA